MFCEISTDRGKLFESSQHSFLLLLFYFCEASKNSFHYFEFDLFIYRFIFAIIALRHLTTLNSHQLADRGRELGSPHKNQASPGAKGTFYGRVFLYFI